MKKKFEAIFFDNDGILVDTEKLYAQACDQTSRSMFAIPFPIEMYQEYGYSRGIGISGFLSQKGFSPEKIAEFQRNRDHLYSQRLKSNLQPMRGVVDFLELLKSRGIPFACVTAAQRQHFLLIHQQTNLLKYFQFWITNEDVKQSKPDPEGYLLAANKMRVSPQNCLVIEDSPRGIQAAKSAGMTVWAVPTEQTKGLDLSLADRVFVNFGELIELFG